MILEEGEILRYLQRNRQTRLDNQEITAFKRYRLTFDLSELEFSRSYPNRRNESDRTMSAEAMNVVVDTLKSEVRSYTHGPLTILASLIFMGEPKLSHLF